MSNCKACAWESNKGANETISGLSHTDAASVVGCSEKSIRRHRKNDQCIGGGDGGSSGGIGSGGVGRGAGGGVAGVSTTDSESESHNGTTGESSYTRYSDRPWGYSDYVEFIREKGMDPDKVTFDWGYTSKPGCGFWNKLNRVREIKPDDGGKGGQSGGASNGPAWPVIQPAAPVEVTVSAQGATESHEMRRKLGYKLSLKCADTQIGFRRIDRGIPGPSKPREQSGGVVGDDTRWEAFHDDRAMAVFLEVCRREQPDSIVILGDFLDLPSQSRWAQEAGFAQTTQMALDRAHEWLATLRAACDSARIVIVEGNHDKRMQSYVEANALAAFGLRQAQKTDSWPVMSIPFLLRLDALRVEYIDAYPAGAYWDNANTRNIHGTKANSKGSTTAQYAHELPTVSTWIGHSHRTELTYRTLLGPGGGAISTYSANPGALCKTDGTVPSVHGAIHSDGSSARVVEDWQQGFGSLLYFPNGFSPAHTQGLPDVPQVHRIVDGSTVYNGVLIHVP